MKTATFSLPAKKDPAEWTSAAPLVTNRVHLFVRPGLHLPVPAVQILGKHGAQGRLKDDRPFGGRPQGLSLTGRAPCYAGGGCGDHHRKNQLGIEMEYEETRPGIPVQ